MIIIDENTEIKLTVLLEKIRSSGEKSRCIYFNLKELPEEIVTTLRVKEKIIATAEKNITSSGAQLYICGDQDIFIIAPHIAGKDGIKFIIDIAAYIGKSSNESWVNFLELPEHVNRILFIVAEKIEKIRKEKEKQKRLLEIRRTELKRMAILNNIENNSDIKNKRRDRKQPELMIIEDDIFSRRLVENVIRNEYHITELGKADAALTTYARIAPDLLFLDINLPDVSGHEILEKIIAMDPEAYVVMLSGNADKENIIKAISKGAKGFIAKPFTREKLFQYINNCPTIYGIDNGNEVTA